MKKSWVALAVLVATIQLTGALAHPDIDGSAEGWETALDLTIVDTVLQSYRSHGNDLEPPSKMISLRAFSKQLPEVYRDRLPKRDGWRGDFLVTAVGEQLAVVSFGPDRILDSEKLLAELGENAYLDPDEIGDDMILILGEGILNRPQTVRDRQRRTMADLRSIATAVEMYSIDYNNYPNLPGALAGLETLATIISPLYIRTTPLHDGWGNPFLFWSDGGSYVIVSGGADGIVEHAYGTHDGNVGEKELYVGGFGDPNRDIVFVNGNFAQWPEGSQQ